jgi:cell division septation protein DedD
VTPIVPKPVALAPKVETTAPVAVPAQKTATHQKPAPATPLAHGYYLNVGLFAKPANAEAATQKLKKAGLPVRATLVKTSKGELTQVRVGPYAKLTQATTAAKKVKKLKLEAAVFRA